MIGVQGRNGVGPSATEAGERAEVPGEGVRGTPGASTELRPRAGGRRRFTAEYKLRILEAAAACAPGEVGALLRREGLYSSHLTKWRQQRAAGGLGPRERAAQSAEAARHTARVERENRRLRQRLERAETIIAVQKKLCSLLQPSLPEDASC